MSKKSANSPLLSPKLWNAHKRLPPRALSRISRAGIAKRIEAEDWASLVSEEVAGFIEKAMRNEETAVLGKKEMIECIKDPTSYFRFPKNVPVQYRKQIYLYVQHGSQEYASYCVLMSRCVQTEPGADRLPDAHTSSSSEVRCIQSATALEQVRSQELSGRSLRCRSPPHTKLRPKCKSEIRAPVTERRICAGSRQTQKTRGHEEDDSRAHRAIRVPRRA